MLSDPLAGVPAARGGERGSDLVPGTEATARDLRWHAHGLRGTLAVLVWWMVLGITRLNVTHLDRDPRWVDIALLVLVAWWITGVAGMLQHSTRMGRTMAAAVARGMTVWRNLPELDRTKARPVAAALLAAGVRHDLEGVRLRLDVLHRAAVAAASRRVDGWRLDVDDLQAWIDGAKEAHRD